MRKILPVLLCFNLFLLIDSDAQIIIQSADLPSAGDTFRVSNGLITPAIDPVPTGANYTWDFSSLQWISQDVDTFLTVASTGSTYALVFIDIPFNPNRANQAIKGLNIQTPPIAGLTISDVVNFYYKSSSTYQQSGFGASINGIGVPITFNSKDRVFNLPLNYSDTDSSFSDYQISLPALGYYGHEQVRLSEVDGWGTLITPYGTFDALRVRSEITSSDTLYIDSLGFGFGFALPQTVEYKWMSPQGGIPMLQINTTMPPFGAEIITSIVYRDSLRVTTGLNDIADSETFEIYPNPSLGYVSLDIASATETEAEVLIHDAAGSTDRRLWKGNLNSGNNRIVLNLAAEDLSAGVYNIEVSLEKKSYFKKLVLTR